MQRPGVIVTNAENTSEGWVRGFQRKLYRAAKHNGRRGFGILHDKVVRKDVLEEAWRRVSANGGGTGVDGQSIEWVRQEYGVDRFLEELREELEDQRYDPKQIRRVYIPKGDGGQRPLGIPTLRDRVAQMAVKLIVEPLFEADFEDCSYGFRPKRSNAQAVEEVHKTVNFRKWVVDVDLKSYFDTIPHDRLLDCVRRRVRDKAVLHLIRRWMKAGILEEGTVKHPVQGTPQGGVLSPLLANIYLHEVDRQWSERDGKIVRFADDMVVLCRNRSQAERALEKIRGLCEGLGLELNEQKTRLVHVRDGFEFLGYAYREAYSQKQGRPVRVKFPKPKGLKAFRQSLKATIQRMPLGVSLREVIAVVNRKLRGWANYFKRGSSYRAALEIAGYVCEQLRLFWRRRKQRKHQRGTRRWPNGSFYEMGLHYVPKLLRA